MIDWRSSRMQGTQGYAHSWPHSRVSKFILGVFSETLDMPAFFSSGAHSIDECAIDIQTWPESKVASNVAGEIFASLEGTYLNVGYIIDRAKCLLSDRKFVLLSRYFVDGFEFMLPVNHDQGRISQNDVPTLHSRMSSVYLYYKSVEVQGGQLFYFIECLKMCDAFLVLRGYSLYADLNSLVAMARLFLPVQLGAPGFMIPFRKWGVVAERAFRMQRSWQAEYFRVPIEVSYTSEKSRQKDPL